MSATTSPLSLASSSEATLASYGATALRVSMGLLFVAHGAIKLFVFTPAGTAAYFASLGLPVIFAYLTIAAEIAGGAALVLGLYSRLVSLALVPVMLGALFLGHAGKGFLFSAPGGGWEFPAFWTVTLVVQALIGDGALAIRPWAPRSK
jgi:putative oxidoreductase